METIINSIESSQITDIQTIKATVLLIDNDLASYFLVYEILSEYSIEVIHARCGMEGLNIFKNTPSICMVITELLLPTIDGFSVLSEIKRCNPYIPVITQTAYVMNNMKCNCLCAGFNEFIDKPIDIISFTNLVKKYL